MNPTSRLVLESWLWVPGFAGTCNDGMCWREDGEEGRVACLPYMKQLHWMPSFLFILYLFSCNIVLILGFSPVFFKYREQVNSFYFCEIWLNYLETFIHCSFSLSLSWSMILGTSRSSPIYPSITFSEV